MVSTRLQFRNLAGRWVSSPNQPVADAGYGEDEGGAAGVALYLVAQAADVDVDSAVALDVGGVAPYRRENLFAAERLAGVAC